MRLVPAALVLGLASLTAADPADLTLIRTIPLQGDTHHPQGIDFDDSHLWVTSVDKATRKGYLHEFSLPAGEHLRTVAVETADRFHPGGLSADGASLWLPVAEYRRDSTSVIQKRNARTLALEFQFDVPDHIGCLTAGPDFLIGANWDSRDFYIWDRTGRLLRKVPNQTPNGYQDIKFIDGRLIASGLLPGHEGAIDWLEYPSLRLLRRIPTGKTSRGVPFTNEGMAFRSGRLFLLPEDSPSRLFEFRVAPPAK